MVDVHLHGDSSSIDELFDYSCRGGGPFATLSSRVPLSSIVVSVKLLCNTVAAVEIHATWGVSMKTRRTGVFPILNFLKCTFTLGPRVENQPDL